MFPVKHEGRELDRFPIEVDLGSVGPGNLPLVTETGGRIPRTEARHVNGNGSACVCLPEHYFMCNPGRFDIVAFLEGPVRDFFLGQILVDAGEPWPFGEWAHGDAGRQAWLQGFVGSLTDSQRLAYLLAVTRETLDERAACPCGTGQQLHGCHLDFLLRLRAILTPSQAAQVFSNATAQQVMAEG